MDDSGCILELVPIGLINALKVGVEKKERFSKFIFRFLVRAAV